MQVPTPLQQIDQYWDILVGPNRNVYAINRQNTGTGTTEVHILDPNTTYRSFLLRTGTALHETDLDWMFLVANNGDIFAINTNNTASGMIEVQVLSAARAYQSFALDNTVTTLPTVTSGWNFALDIYNNLYCIQTTGTVSGSTDLYVLTASSGYRETRYFPTALHQAPWGQFSFAVSPQLDLFCIKRFGTGTGKTEVHQLSGASNYRQWILNTGTALHETDWEFPDGQWAFTITPDPNPDNVDVYSFKKYGTGSGMTEIHVLQRRYKEWSAGFSGGWSY